MTNHKVLSIDFETASTCDLKKTGAAVYARHPDTFVLCMAYAFDDGPTEVWRIGDPIPYEVLAHVRSRRTVRAWNAAFEYNIWNQVFLKQLGLPIHVTRDYDLTPSMLEDTMIRAAYWGLPLSLDAAALAAGLDVVKDKEGHSLMLRMCRPRTIDKKTGKKTWWHEDDPARYDRLVEYCRQDVMVERAVANTLLPLPAAEQALWELDQKMNNKGIPVDLKLVALLETIAASAVVAANKEMSRITGGRVNAVTSVGAMLPELKTHGYLGDDLRRGTVDARLADVACVGVEREILQLRSDAARTSAAKLATMKSAGPEGIIRGMLQFYGASRTGRWAGRLVQLQNLPRGVIQNIAAAVKIVLGGASLEQVEALFGAGMGVVSSCLRACVYAGDGNELVSVDFSQIEARVLAWLAGQQDILDVFASGEDVYVQAAAGIYGVEVADVTKDQRQIGKVAVLALGYAGGVGAFQTMAGAYGVQIEDDDAEAIKVAWRTKNHKIVDYWRDLDRAARNAIGKPSGKFAVGNVTFGMWGEHLIVQLPSGRTLTYRNAQVRTDPHNPQYSGVTYMGLDQYTRKWTRLRTYGGKFAENITQAVARDLMAYAMIKCDRAGHDLRLTVHDELIALAPTGQGQATCDAITKIMRDVPEWAHGLPQDADGWTGDRYKK